jgi:hypothetical protein
MIVSAFVHQIDEVCHPTMSGWRWAVHLGSDPGDLGSCVQAGHALSEAAARYEVQWHVGAVVNTVRLLRGVTPEHRVVRLDADPIPAGGDRVTVL